MDLVKVWNDNTVDFKQEYKGNLIKIPAKSFIEMDWDEANTFKSHPYPMAFDGMGQQTVESYKMIRVEGRPGEANKVIAYRSHKDGKLFGSKAELEAYEASFTEEAFADSEGARIAASKKGKKTQEA